ncbi:MAG: hypothetical protein ACYDDY_18515 [Mucilaginibacter sp.]
MKNLFVALILLVLTNQTHAQVGNENISYKDSIKLTKTWRQFKHELYLKDIRRLRSISCKKVSGLCILEPININCNTYSSPDKLFSRFYKEMFPAVGAIIFKGNYKIAVYSSIKDKAMKIKHPTQYQIWFVNNSEPGNQFAFIFEKITEKFKFCGLDQIP